MPEPPHIPRGRTISTDIQRDLLIQRIIQIDSNIHQTNQQIEARNAKIIETFDQQYDPHNGQSPGTAINCVFRNCSTDSPSGIQIQNDECDRLLPVSRDVRIYHTHRHSPEQPPQPDNSDYIVKLPQEDQNKLDTIQCGIDANSKELGVTKAQALRNSQLLQKLEEYENENSDSDASVQLSTGRDQDIAICESQKKENTTFLDKLGSISPFRSIGTSFNEIEFTPRRRFVVAASTTALLALLVFLSFKYLVRRTEEQLFSETSMTISET